MSDWENALDHLKPEHAEALKWFAMHAGQIVPWSEIKEHAEAGPRLVNQAKGIYKPAQSDYALSVRQTLNGPYADLEVERNRDGSWLYPYFQENPNPADRDREATNRGLMRCLADGVPVGVLIQTKPKPGVEYRVLGLALVVDWQDGYFFLQGYTTTGNQPAPEHSSEASKARARLERRAPSESFDPTNNEDRREKAIAEVVRRRGQGKFRTTLLAAYGQRCAISGCDAVEALEAAHITPYLGDATNHPQNGLLLRADLHSLFDLGLVAIDPNNMTVLLSDDLSGTAYEQFHGNPLRIPEEPGVAPSREALTQHAIWAGLYSSEVAS